MYFINKLDIKYPLFIFMEIDELKKKKQIIK